MRSERWSSAALRLSKSDNWNSSRGMASTNAAHAASRWALDHTHRPLAARAAAVECDGERNDARRSTVTTLAQHKEVILDRDDDAADLVSAGPPLWALRCKGCQASGARECLTAEIQRDQHDLCAGG